MRTIETPRLILRPWREEDAEGLYEYARDPRVGPMAGWPVHTSVENSREIIRDILMAEDNCAVTLRGDDRAVGSVGFKDSEAPGGEGELEIGYWLGVPFWGRGLIPEAVRALLAEAFGPRGAGRVWCGHYEGNDKSRRVIEKCGFRYVLTCRRMAPALGEERTELFYAITKEEFAHGELPGPGGVRRG